jgi:hypothetical protein
MTEDEPKVLRELSDRIADFILSEVEGGKVDPLVGSLATASAFGVVVARLAPMDDAPTWWKNAKKIYDAGYMSDMGLRLKAAEEIRNSHHPGADFIKLSDDISVSVSSWPAGTIAEEPRIATTFLLPKGGSPSFTICHTPESWDAFRRFLFLCKPPLEIEPS